MFALGVTVMAGVYFAIRPDWKQTLRYIGFGCAIAALVQLAVVILTPQTAIHQDVNAGAWRGIFFEKNALGAAAAGAGLIFVTLVHVDKAIRWFWVTSLLLAVVLLIGARSTTSFIAFSIPSMIYIVLAATKGRPSLRLAVIYAGATSVGMAVFVSMFFPDLLFDLVGKDATFTGRTEIWALATNSIAERPWTGFGYAAFWQEEYGPSFQVSSQLEWIVPNAHSTWLEQGLNSGIPGIIGLGVLTVWSFFRALHLIVRREIAVPFVILIQLVIVSFSESTILWTHNTLTCVLFVFASTLACRLVIPEKAPQVTEAARPSKHAVYTAQLAFKRPVRVR